MGWVIGKLWQAAKMLMNRKLAIETHMNTGSELLLLFPSKIKKTRFLG